MLTNVGLRHFATRDKHFEFGGRTTELDGLFAIDNVFVVVEETTLSSEGLSDHLRKKAEVFKCFCDNPELTVSTLVVEFPEIDRYLRGRPDIDRRSCIVRSLYCTLNDLDEEYRLRYADAFHVLSFGALQYFLRLSRTIKRSARFELLKFLNIELEDIAGVSRAEHHTYRALLLPEVESGFPPGHRIVSFLVDPKTLIERGYVLRADSWRDHDALYQRLLEKAKIGSMRRYLDGEERVFVNNVIVTLPPTVTFTPDAAPGRRRVREEIATGNLVVPRAFNTIGIIDGQHRVYSYHEGDDQFEPRIAVLRDKQHLLATGIIYPSNSQEETAKQFEAKLFLEINDKQKRVRGDLKQAIERIVDPYSPVAIAKAVIERLAATGPLQGKLEVHFFDVGRLKTTSIVSYGLRHIVDVGGSASLFQLWPGPGKTAVKEGRDRQALAKYVNFAANRLNLLIAGYRASIPGPLWTPDKRASRALSATAINGLVFCMRRLIEADKVADDFQYYRRAFGAMSLDFRPGRFPYKSSGWRALGDYFFELF
ncbi:MAG TPA: DGQHR domain-containing protein [Bryobacteraceae bacterium]|nr:DGQHR domain-containing protein [Bryobacteraceae bacterium]